MRAGTTPEDADVVVRPDIRNGTRVFVICTGSGPDQLVVRTRDAALERARAFAKHQQGRVWIRNGNHDFTLVDDYSVDVLRDAETC